MKLRIDIENVNPNFTIDEDEIRYLIRLIFSREKETEGEISIVFVDHKLITMLNKKFLNRDYSTDVLSFPLGEPGSKAIVGEIYVNLDRVAEQAQEYNVPVREELKRIVIHGVLHLMGYDDQQEDARKKMSEREDYYLNLFE